MVLKKEEAGIPFTPEDQLPLRLAFDSRVWQASWFILKVRLHWAD